MNVGGQQLNDDKVREVVDNIITHPSFCAVPLINIFNNSCDQSTTTTSDTTSSPPLFGPVNDNSSGSAAHFRATSVHRQSTCSSSNTNPGLNASTVTSQHTTVATPTGRYITPCEEFSELFQRGSSRGRAPTFQRGISHR